MSGRTSPRNALAGDLLEVFGVDLTAATSVCAACGASARVAEAIVYMRGPGASGTETELMKVLDQDDPPRLIHRDSTGCRQLPASE